MSDLYPGRRRLRWARHGQVVLIVAVAVGWAGLLSWSSVRLTEDQGLGERRHGGLPALPAYRLELSGDAEPHRTRFSTEPVVTGEMLTVLLRPVESVAGPVAVKAFVEQGDHRRPWAVHFERSNAGAFLLRAPVRSLPGLGPGRWRLTFLVGRPWALPPGPAVARRREPSDDWYLLDGELEITAP